MDLGENRFGFRDVGNLSFPNREAFDMAGLSNLIAGGASRAAAAAAIVAAVLSALAAPAALAGDPGFEAMLAQRDGDFAACARHADVARRMPGNTYRMHRLFAACAVNAAEDARQADGDVAAYVARIEDALGALELLRRTPGAYHQPKADNVLAATIDDLKRRIAGARMAQPTH